MKRVAHLAAALLASACVDPEATEKCEAFRDLYCERQEELCDAVVAEACREVFDAAVDCGEAVDVADTYDDCMVAVRDLEACPDDLPLGCAGVILLAPDD